MTDSGLVMLWTYTQPATSDVADAPAMLGAAVVIPALADLPQAAAAVQSIVTEQGNQAQFAAMWSCIGSKSKP